MNERERGLLKWSERNPLEEEGASHWLPGLPLNWKRCPEGGREERSKGKRHFNWGLSLLLVLFHATKSRSKYKRSLRLSWIPTESLKRILYHNKLLLVLCCQGGQEKRRIELNPISSVAPHSHFRVQRPCESSKCHHRGLVCGLTSIEEANFICNKFRVCTALLHSRSCSQGLGKGREYKIFGCTQEQ